MSWGQLILLPFLTVVLTLKNSYSLSSSNWPIDKFQTLKDLDSYDSQAYLNEVIDLNIDEIRSVLQKIDPTILPDIELKKHGRLFNGHLRNISLITRTGNCSAKYSNKLLSFDFNMGWKADNELLGEYAYRYIALFFKREGELTGTMDHLSFNLALIMDFEQYEIILRSIKVTDIGDLKINIKGTPGDELRALIASLVLNSMKQRIITTIETSVSTLLQSYIDKLNSLLHRHKHPFKFIGINSRILSSKCL